MHRELDFVHKFFTHKTIKRGGIQTAKIGDARVSTKDAMGKMFFTMMSAFSELEANLLSERTKKDLEAARARGRKGGRPSLPDHKKREIKILYNEQKLTGEELVKKTGVSRSTVYRTIK